MSYSIPAYHAKSSHYAPYLTQEHQITKPSKTYLRPPHSTTNNTPPLSKRPASVRNHVHSTSSLSSTPHAPRQKKPILKYGRLPLTRSVVKQHGYLDEGVINGLSSPLGQGRGEKVCVCVCLSVCACLSICHCRHLASVLARNCLRGY